MRPRLSLKGRALQWLAQREHSRLELRRKLLNHARQQLEADASQDAGQAGPDASARRAPPTNELQASVDALLDWLAEQQHLSEDRFVEARVRTRAARHGNLRIRQELARHGLQLAPEDEQALKDSEVARAKEVWLRKFGGPARDAAGHARQVRFLTGRGFSADVIRRLLRGVDDD